MNEKKAIDAQRVKMLAEIASLPLDESRASIISPPLSDWVTDANELNRKMSGPEFWEVIPVTVFRHPSIPGGK